MADERFQPDMTMDWRGWPVVTPNQPQNSVLPTWGAIGSPLAPGATPDPRTPSGFADRMLGLGGLGAMTYQIPLWYTLLGVAGSCLGIYHGYKRNRGSIGWTIGWALFGSALPAIALPVMFIQGVGKPKKRGR